MTYAYQRSGQWPGIDQGEMETADGTMIHRRHCCSQSFLCMEYHRSTSPLWLYLVDENVSSSRLMAGGSLPSEDSELVDERLAARAFSLFGLVFGMFQAGIG